MDVTLAEEFAKILVGQSAACVPPDPDPFEDGLTVEHILITVDVVHRNKIIQYDDSCAHIINTYLKGNYAGVVTVNAQAKYDHCKVENHPKGCECHWCGPHKDEPRTA